MMHPIIIETLPSEEKPTDRRAFTIDDDTELVERRETKRRKGRNTKKCTRPDYDHKKKEARR